MVLSLDKQRKYHKNIFKYKNYAKMDCSLILTHDLRIKGWVHGNKALIVSV